MTHQEILNKTKADIDSLCAQAKERLNAIAPKGLEVRKWYKTPHGGLYCVVSIEDKFYNAYGFSVSGYWFENEGVPKGCVSYDREATRQEVEKALIEEANRRGFGRGVEYIPVSQIGSLPKDYYIGDYEPRINNDSYQVHIGFQWVFANGQWATIIEQDKFAELKEAHRNGAEIQFYDEKRNKWFDSGVPCWNPDFKYRIKPEEKPKVGDVCKFWSDDEPGFIVSHYLREDNGLHTFDESIYFDHAKTLTQQEAIDLLFNKAI